jgi:putative tricarboxylic transport membrane protein
VAFSGGSLLNMAQGKFGRYGENDVRWLAAVGADYGAVIVNDNSPFKSLKDVMDAVKADPTKVVFGAGGTVGSQDWMKAALVAKAAGVNHKAMRFVAFEGGGEAVTALQGGHIQVLFGRHLRSAPADQGRHQDPHPGGDGRQAPAGELANVPTAKEQGCRHLLAHHPRLLRGPQGQRRRLQGLGDTFKKMMATPAYDKLRAERGLFPSTW